MQVLGRTIGKGQGQRTRKLKLGTTIIMCEQCAKRFAKTQQSAALADEAEKVLNTICRKRVETSPGLFD